MDVPGFSTVISILSITKEKARLPVQYPIGGSLQSSVAVLIVNREILAVSPKRYTALFADSEAFKKSHT